MHEITMHDVEFSDAISSAQRPVANIYIYIYLYFIGIGKSLSSHYRDSARFWPPESALQGFHGPILPVMQQILR